MSFVVVLVKWMSVYLRNGKKAKLRLFLFSHPKVTQCLLCSILGNSVLLHIVSFRQVSTLCVQLWILYVYVPVYRLYMVPLRVGESRTLGIFMYMDNFPLKPHPNPRKHYSNRIKSRINQFPCSYWTVTFIQAILHKKNPLKLRDQF